MSNIPLHMRENTDCDICERDKTKVMVYPLPPHSDFRGVRTIQICTGCLQIGYDRTKEKPSKVFVWK